MKILRALVLVCFVLTLTYCKKTENIPATDPKAITDLSIPAGFDWKMAHPITFHVVGTSGEVVTIETTDGSIQMHKSCIKQGTTSADIRISIPDYIREVRVNGLQVTITGPDVTVNLPLTKDLMVPNFNLVFDGVNDYIDLGDIAELNGVAAFTIEGWIKQTNNTDLEYVFDKNLTSSARISIAPYGGELFVIVGNGANTYGKWDNYALTISGGIWFHVAAVYDGTGVANSDRLKLYVNGVERAMTYSGTIPATTANMAGEDAVLGNNNNSGQYFGGYLDEWRIWSVARSAAEINDNFAKILAGSTPNLIACWRMDEGSGVTAYDVTPNGYDATIQGCTWNAQPTGFDSDEDGVWDENDDYPLDANRAFNNFFPVTDYGTLVFEDIWPSYGDYDFNDLVLGYRFTTVTNASNEVVEVLGTFIVRANGAKMLNGFGFELPDADPGIMTNVEVSGYSHTGGIIILDGVTRLESGQTNPVVIAFDNTYDLMNGIFNTISGGPVADPDSVTITLAVTGGGPYVAADFALDTWNPFLFINQDRGRELHLLDYPPTDLMNTAYFGMGDDVSDPVTGDYYKSAIFLPWALDFPTSFDYVEEYTWLTTAYLHFNEWAESGGMEYPDWYSNTGAGYRNTTNIYQP